VEGGGGVANISQSVFVAFLPVSERARGIRDRGRMPLGPLGLVPEIDIDRSGRRRSETDLALTVGGGVDFRIWRGLAVGPNISYLRLFGNLQDRNLTRIGGRASYRF
jgi:opacity protein-like surface antigen